MPTSDSHDAFGDHIYSGKEHVEKGKPEPDLYLHAARELGAEIDRTVIIEDSKSARPERWLQERR